MMEFTTLRTLTTDLLNIVRSSNVSASEPTSRRQLENWAHQYRALLIKRDVDKGKRPNPDYIQTINHLRLEPVETVGDNIVHSRDESGTFVYRTILEIPKTLDLNFISGFMFIGTPLGEEIPLIAESRAQWQQYKKYTSKERVCYLKDNHLYIVNDFPLEFIEVRAIFEVPSEVGRFVNPLTNQPYFNLDSPYPIPINMVPELKAMILEREFKILVNSPTDTSNDDSNNPK